MTKKELRKIYKEKRLAISSRDKLKMDDLLLINFQQLSFEHTNVLLSYWPMAHQAEPNSILYSSYLRHMMPGLRTAYTVTDFATLTMQAVEINENTVYNTNAYGITEPREGTLLDPEEIDIVFVPFLVCDANGYRVGYGKGFYDRFLARCREDVLKIGFTYFEPVAAIDDVQDFDIPLNFCITTENIYEF